jgi:phage-related minor tail protein
MPDSFEEIVIPVRLETQDLRRDMKRMEGLSRSFASTMSNAFAGAILGGRRFSSVLRSLAMSLARMTLSAAMRPVFSGLTGALGGLLGSARGNAFSAGRVRAFANGGVVGSPALFPMRSGMGLMGEAGPEAILPLARGADGKLGVRAAQGGPAVHVTMNITTPDAQSFTRSSAQVAAALARAVEQGQRNL